MPRSYIVGIPNFDHRTVATSKEAADIILGDGRLCHRDTLVSQIRNMNPGDTAFLTGGISVQVIGHGDEEEAPPPEPGI